MNTCETCVHWTEKAPYERPEDTCIRACNHPKLRDDMGWQSSGPDEADALYYGYQEEGGFWTGPDFGCVHHIEKETE